MGYTSRINKYLALCGIASRRAAEILVTEGRVSVNGEIISDLGRQIDHDLDTVTVNGEPVAPTKERIYLLMNKPPLTITSSHDPQGRRTVIDVLADARKEFSLRVFAVGRLDYDTEGALLLTNDGMLAHRLTHPKYQIEKVYQALVDGKFTKEHSEKIRAGIELEDGAIGHAEAQLLNRAGSNSYVKLILTEGRKREVKQLLSACGLNTLQLTRLTFAGISAKGLKSGGVRELTSAELTSLRKQVSGSSD
ncbi:rRNA pseudouridine synthase [Gemmatimonas aurantiaca]|nr:rRNA pseudouridine synthase [Gemmatimonas aurantiaca]